MKFVKENEKRTLGNWSARTWVLKVEFVIIIIIIIRNELYEIELREYRFLIIIIIIIIIRNELQEIERLEYRFLIIIIIIRNEL